MNKNLYTACHSGRTLLTALGLLGCLSGRLPAQTPPAADQATPESDAAKLVTKVHLTLGKTTLINVTRALSEQTGLTIQAAPYLWERKLTVQMDSLSAQEALDALCDLNDWVWRKTESGHYLLSRPTLRIPGSAVEVTEKVPPLLPPDIRRFLGIGVPAKEFLHPFTTEKERRFAQGVPEHLQLRFQIGHDVRSLLSSEEAQLYGELAPKLKGDVKLSCKALTPKQRERLVLIFALHALRESDFDLIRGFTQAYGRDLANTTIELEQGNHIFIGAHDQERGNVGYGTTVHLPDSPAGLGALELPARP